eukprot:12901310-Prorocentrum_lima.AAC.1
MSLRHWDREPVCPGRAISMDKTNRPFKAVVLDHDLPKVSTAASGPSQDQDRDPEQQESSCRT